jgi:hypothetical protein
MQDYPRKLSASQEIEKVVAEIEKIQWRAPRLAEALKANGGHLVRIGANNYAVRLKRWRGIRSPVIQNTL